MQDVCIFAHFDPDDIVDEYVFRYLETLKQLGFLIVFVSTSNLTQSNINLLYSYCYDVILRTNAGLDFGSWSEGLAKHGSAINGRLLLANDSVYGPWGDLPATLDRLTAKPADFYGMVESIDVAPHVQSWFLLFENWVANHPAFRSIFAQPLSGMSKKEIIANGEIALSRRLNEAGFRYEALYLNRRGGLIARHHAINPTHILWHELLFDVGVPFLKIDLLRKNPMKLESANEILRLIEPTDPELCRMIRLHLKRIVVTETSDGRGNSAVGRWIRMRRYTMIRKGYRLNRTGRKALEVCNFVKFGLFMVVLRVGQSLHVLLCHRRV